MDKKLAGLLGAVSALALTHAANADPPRPTAALEASSYADLLRPIPDALTLLAVTPETEPSAPLETVEYYHHHHHHHHRNAVRHVLRRLLGVHHHHHHHHHHNYYRGY